MSDTDEKWADWCSGIGHGAITCGTRMIERSRESMGEKWCFYHRRRHEFWWVVMVPDGMSYHGPSGHTEGIGPDCTHLFPGRIEVWDE